MDNMMQKNELRHKRMDRVRKTVIYMLLTFWAVAVLFPFFWMLLTSIKSYSEYSSEFVPKFYALFPTWENFKLAFTGVSLGRYLLNTVIFTLATTALMLFVSVLAAFAFARLNFRFKNLVFTGFLALMMIPSELVIITNFVTVTNME